MKRKISNLLMLGALFVCPAMADDYFVDENTEHCELFRQLNGDNVPGHCNTSSAASRKGIKSSLVAPEKPPIQPPGRIALDMVNFAYNSYGLSDKANRVLDHIATIMTDPMSAGIQYRIEGNTDRKGSVQYNQKLSERRAQSVRQFLIEKGVDSGRLTVIGNGYSRPYDRHHPYHGINRRVEIINTSLEKKSHE